MLINKPNRKQSVLVHIHPLTLTAELYYKPNKEYDNSDISECVLSLLDKASEVCSSHFDDEEVEGKVQEVDADTESDMLVYACFIAQCITFGQMPINEMLPTKSMAYLRHLIINAVFNIT